MTSRLTPREVADQLDPQIVVAITAFIHGRASIDETMPTDTYQIRDFLDGFFGLDSMASWTSFREATSIFDGINSVLAEARGVREAT